MKWRDLVKSWGLTNLKLNAGFLQCEFSPTKDDMTAAWYLYVELITRVTTQQLPPSKGDELTALKSVYELFPLTREILKKQGEGCIEFTRIAIVVLNQVIRPFTTKWHGISEKNGFDSEESRDEFRSDLDELQEKLRRYTKLLAYMARVEDVTDMEILQNGPA